MPRETWTFHGSHLSAFLTHEIFSPLCGRDRSLVLDRTDSYPLRDSVRRSPQLADSRPMAANHRLSRDVLGKSPGVPASASREPQRPALRHPPLAQHRALIDLPPPLGARDTTGKIFDGVRLVRDRQGYLHANNVRLRDNSLRTPSGSAIATTPSDGATTHRG